MGSSRERVLTVGSALVAPLKVVRACPSMLNEVKRRGLAVALSSAERADAEADARDEVCWLCDRLLWSAVLLLSWTFVLGACPRCAWGRAVMGLMMIGQGCGCCVVVEEYT